MALAEAAIHTHEQSIGNKTGELSTRVGTFDFDLGVPTIQSTAKLYHREGEVAKGER